MEWVYVIELEETPLEKVVAESQDVYWQVHESFLKAAMVLKDYSPACLLADERKNCG
jgi:hypothetical protein